ncbi:MAG: hypothetical protein ACRDJO_11455, partial [Actinomycetota bacterium]
MATIDVLPAALAEVSTRYGAAAMLADLLERRHARSPLDCTAGPAGAARERLGAVMRSDLASIRE